MSEARPNRRPAAGGVGRAVAGALALSALAGAAALAAEGSTAAVLALQAVALAVGAAAWRQARAARAAADTARADLTSLAQRLVQAEIRFAQQQAPAGADSLLRSTMAEVTGEIGVLGGLVRDLAETVAAQDRDVAALKERLAPASDPRARSGPPAPPPDFGAESAHPEPSLLPSMRREPARPGELPDRMSLGPDPADAGAGRVGAGLGGGAEALSDADARQMAAIVEAFEADRVELHLQPVVTLPQRKISFYEALARLRLADDTLLAPAEFLPLLERLGHAPEFDRRMVGRALAIARHLVMRRSEAIVSVNLSPRALEEAGFLRSLGRLLDSSPDALGRVAFELSQRCWRTLDAESAAALAAMRDRGALFALDRATDLHLDPPALADRGARFVKIPADVLLAEPSPALDIEPRDLAAILRGAGIDLVVERVEQEETVPHLLDLHVPLAQGFVFSPPRAVRMEVLSPNGASEIDRARDVLAQAPGSPPGGHGRPPHGAISRGAA